MDEKELTPEQIYALVRKQIIQLKSEEKTLERKLKENQRKQKELIYIIMGGDVETLVNGETTKAKRKNKGENKR